MTDLDDFEQRTVEAARALLESGIGSVDVPAIGEFLFPKTIEELPLPAWWPTSPTEGVRDPTPRDALNSELQTTVKVLARRGDVSADLSPDGWWVVHSVENG
jgi:hypothetical protein